MTDTGESDEVAGGGWDEQDPPVIPPAEFEARLSQS